LRHHLAQEVLPAAHISAREQFSCRRAIAGGRSHGRGLFSGLLRLLGLARCCLIWSTASADRKIFGGVPARYL
jgi:hypothetical protein